MAKAGGVDLLDLSRLSEDDRIAVLKMVKEGELSIQEAISKVKEQTDMAHGGTLAKGMKLAQLGRGARFNRQGAMRKNRGRLLLDFMVHRASAFCVLILEIKEGRELMSMNKRGTADPYVRVFLDGKKKKSQVRKNTRNPMFNEKFQYEVRTDSDLSSAKLTLEVKDKSALRKNQFMGMMTFSLADIFEGDVENGWFRLLDQKRGEMQNVPIRDYKKSNTNDSMSGAAKPPSRPVSMVPKSVTPPVPQMAPRPVSMAPAPDDKSNPFSESSLRAAKKAAPAPQRKAPAAAAAAAAPPHRSAPTAPVAAAAAQPKMEKVDASSFQYLKVLGQGSFGKVLLAEKPDIKDKLFAIKMLKKEAVIEEDDVECTLTERRVLALSSGCHFLTNLYATFQTPERLYFVMEFVDGGDLMFHIQKLRKFSLAQATFYTAEILLGLWFLHENGVLYRDLKLDNVMLDHEGHIKIADFGMCKENVWGVGTTTTFCGTPGYLAPEIIQELPYGTSVDFWSLGVLLFEMLVGDSPFEGEDEESLFENILHARVDYPSRLPKPAKEILQGFLTRNPKSRLGCTRGNPKDQVKAHPFFTGCDWDKLIKREVEPPFKPFGEAKASGDAAAMFDPEFTEASTRLTPSDPFAINNLDQSAFNGFSFVNKAWGAAPGKAAAVLQQSTRRNENTAHAWYRPDLARDEAMRRLMGRQPGTFYVRESSTQPGCYAIAMVTEGEKVWNGLVTPRTTKNGATLYKLFVKQKFNSLADLIDFYCQHPVTADSKGNKLCLVKPKD